MPEIPKVVPCPRCNGTKKFNKKACALCRATGCVATKQPLTHRTHVAERAIDINGRVVQRCVWCGWKLIDKLVRDQPVDGRGKPKPIFTWAPGDFVRVPLDAADGAMRRAELMGHINSDPLPADFCYELVEQC